MCINSFNVSDNDMNSIGTGIYLDASILDHSCKPNAVAVFEQTTIYIRSVADIPELDWNLVEYNYCIHLKFVQRIQIGDIKVILL